MLGVRGVSKQSCVDSVSIQNCIWAGIDPNDREVRDFFCLIV
jgi:hypothetical protein